MLSLQIKRRSHPDSSVPGYGCFGGRLPRTSRRLQA
jgi:hypothetical protein